MKKCCQGIQELIYDFVEKNLPQEIEDAIRKELARCPHCVAFLNTYLMTSKICNKVLTKKMPKENKSRLFCFLEEELLSKGSWKGPQKPKS